MFSCEHLSFTYQPLKKALRKGEKPHYALREISFSLRPGECLALAGTSGSGKSTLLQILAHLLPPTSGSVSWQENTSNSNEETANQQSKIGFIMQQPEYMLFASSVFEEVAFGPRNRGVLKEELEKLVENSLASVGLFKEELRNTSPFSLSAGQQRRVAFAAILALEPSVLLVDEPTSGLDVAGRLAVLDLLEQLHSQGITLVLASHSMDDIAHLADRILVLEKGTCSFLGTPEELFVQHAEQLSSLGLELPRAQAFAKRLEKGGIHLSKKLFTTETLAAELAFLLRDNSPIHPNAST